MKKYYPGPALFIAFCIRIVLLAALFLGSAWLISATAQGLEFKNSSLVSGSAGKDNAVYRFPLVTSNVDALVKIKGRSSSLVKLVSIDLSNTGHDKAFQPQVTYNNNKTPYGTTDWWMEFEVSFVHVNTTAPVTLSGFDISAIDIDGDSDDLNEWVAFYNQKTATTETNTQLQVSNLLETVLGLLTTVGKKFTGPTANYSGIDTSATRVMTTNKYENTSSFRLKTGGHSTGKSNAADRMYSFWFKSFTYQAPVASTLPVKLSAFTAQKAESKAVLNWSTAMEKNVSHFVIERSLDGNEFTDRGMIFTNGDSETPRDYNFTDDIKTVSKDMIYYRLRIVDLDGQVERSSIRMIKNDGLMETMSIQAYPNPVINELRITLPAAWQDQSVKIEVINSFGHVVKLVRNNRAGQTESISLDDINTGMYIIRASNGTQTAVQRIVKSK